jgi:hypothetical protein
MTRRLTVAQVACGIVAGVGIALGATVGLVFAASLYGGGSKVVPIVAANTTGARASAAREVVDESGPSAAAPATKAAVKPTADTRKRSTRKHASRTYAQHRAGRVKRRAASKPAVVQVRQTAPATTAPAKQLAQTAPVTTRAPTPARTTPSKPTAKPTRSASGSGGTFDDSG